MKKFISTAVCCVASTLLAPAQQLAQPVSAAAAPALDTASSGLLPQAGPHHRILTKGQTADGSPSSGKVVEIASGLNFWDGKQWAPSEAVLEDTPDGFVAQRVQHKLRISHELNVRDAITLVTPQGDVLYSTPVGIGLFNPVDGSFALIATLTNSTASLISSNEVAFENPFDGVCSTLYYRIDRGNFEQDIVFTGKLDPGDWGFPTNSRIQIITELFSPPTPLKTVRPLSVEQNPLLRAQMVSPDLIDEELAFGELILGAGYAYTTASPAAENGAVAPVAKQLTKTADGRFFLVESVSYPWLKDALASLPDCSPPGEKQARFDRKKQLKQSYSAIPSPVGVRVSSARSPSFPSFASVSAPRFPRHPGVTIDYRATLTSSTNLLAADVTYLASGALSCGNLTIEGGTVVKYKAGASISATSITMKSGLYRPAFFTAVDDDTVGESMNGYTNSGWTGTISSSGYANPAFDIGSTSVSFSNCVIRYAQSAVHSVLNGTTISVSLAHAQLLNCIKGVEITTIGSSTAFGTYNLSLNNGLMSKVQYPIYATTSTFTFNPTLLHCTLDQAAALITGGFSPSCAFKSTNSIYANVTNSSSGNFFGANNVFYKALPKFGAAQLGSDTVYPFQSVGAANYYLSDSAGFRNAGATSGVPPSVQLDMRKRTTYPPVVVCNTTLGTSQTLSPQAQRDTDLPDVGYHYDPLDYAIGWVLVTNCSLTVNPGTAIATFGTNSGTYGLAIGQGATLQCQGQANNLSWFVAYNMVQEQPITNWFQPSYASVCSEFQGLTPAPAINCRFTSWSIAAQVVPHFYGPTNTGPFNFQDCEFHGGKLLSIRPTINLTNVLLERVYTDLEPKDGLTNTVRVGLVYGGAFTFAPSNSVVQDVLFDKAALTNWNGYNGGFNVYVTNFQRLQPTQTTDLLLSASPSYQVGALGVYYQLTNAAVINWDTNTAANTIGYYHFTVITNLVSGLQIKETNSWTDVSYHYVATDGAGNPIDTDGDAVPDYIEDVNGNGAVDSGETNWQDPNDLGLSVIITQPTTNWNIPN
jgi:hypothetical protein